MISNAIMSRCVHYYSSKANRTVTFRSIKECAYAIMLDLDHDVLQWNYETVKMIYFDGFSGKQKTYICDFNVHRRNFIENVEVKPKNLQLPLDKYLYAQNCIKNWRWTTEDELERSQKLFYGGKNSGNITFSNKPPNRRYYNFWSKYKGISIPSGWRKLSTDKIGVYYKHRLVNNRIKGSRSTKAQNLDLEKIIELIKENCSLKAIAQKFDVDPRTITAFLEKRSYIIRWKTSRRHNEIRYATKKVWPL